jgi:hypothetical protein
MPMKHFARRILRFIQKLLRILILSLSGLLFLALLTASVWLFLQGEVGVAFFFALASLSGGIVVSHMIRPWIPKWELAASIIFWSWLGLPLVILYCSLYIIFINKLGWMIAHVTYDKTEIVDAARVLLFWPLIFLSLTPEPGKLRFLRVIATMILLIPLLVYGIYSMSYVILKGRYDFFGEAAVNCMLGIWIAWIELKNWRFKKRQA